MYRYFIVSYDTIIQNTIHQKESISFFVIDQVLLFSVWLFSFLGNIIHK